VTAMNTDIKLLDVVELLEGMPEEGLAAGAKGTVVEVYKTPSLAYEVEFCNDCGETIAMLALLPEKIRVIWTRP
jgi:Domain of unknown function (DUF4926)